MVPAPGPGSGAPLAAAIAPSVGGPRSVPTPRAAGPPPGHGTAGHGRVVGPPTRWTTGPARPGRETAPPAACRRPPGAETGARGAVEAAAPPAADNRCDPLPHHRGDVEPVLCRAPDGAASRCRRRGARVRPTGPRRLRVAACGATPRPAAQTRCTRFVRRWPRHAAPAPRARPGAPASPASVPPRRRSTPKPRDGGEAPAIGVSRRPSLRPAGLFRKNCGAWWPSRGTSPPCPFPAPKVSAPVFRGGAREMAMRGAPRSRDPTLPGRRASRPRPSGRGRGGPTGIAADPRWPGHARTRLTARCGPRIGQRAGRPGCPVPRDHMEARCSAPSRGDAGAPVRCGRERPLILPRRQAKTAQWGRAAVGTAPRRHPRPAAERIAWAAARPGCGEPVGPARHRPSPAPSRSR